MKIKVRRLQSGLLEYRLDGTLITEDIYMRLLKSESAAGGGSFFRKVFGTSLNRKIKRILKTDTKPQDWEFLAKGANGAVFVDSKKQPQYVYKIISDSLETKDKDQIDEFRKDIFKKKFVMIRPKNKRKKEEFVEYTKDDETDILLHIQNTATNQIAPELYAVFKFGEKEYLILSQFMNGSLAFRDKDESIEYKINQAVSLSAHIHYLFTDLKEKLEELHRLDIAHGDIKPSNILFETTSDRIHFFLTDFGESTRTVENRSAYGYGTPIFSCDFCQSEEKQFKKDKKKMDIWALGIVLLIMIINLKLKEFEPRLFKRLRNYFEDVHKEYLRTDGPNAFPNLELLNFLRKALLPPDEIKIDIQDKGQEKREKNTVFENDLDKTVDFVTKLSHSMNKEYQEDLKKLNLL